MLFSDYFKIERKIQGLDDVVIHDVPLWRIVRTNFRRSYLGLGVKTNKPTISVKEIVFNTCNSFGGLLKLTVRWKKYSNVFFPHPRLFYVNDKYMDRLSDPLIDYSGIGDDYIILERHQNGIHKRPRYHKSHVIYLDFIDNIGMVLSFLLKGYYAKKYSSEIRSLVELLEGEFHIDDIKYTALFGSLLTSFSISRHLISPVFKLISPKTVFFAPRITFYYVIDYCKKHKITSVELQHGVTVGETPLYSGSYSERIDPDYFLVFGSTNIGPQFYMPLDRILNVGFPYKTFIQEMNLEKYDEYTVLVVSEPSITQKIVRILLELSSLYHVCKFHIRCHPQERISEKLLALINGTSNIMVVPNTIESFCALSQYTNVMGENSSVLYEAMSLGKKVARINYGGLLVKETDLIHGGAILDSPEDFGRFLENTYCNSRDSKDIYSDYNPEVFNHIL